MPDSPNEIVTKTVACPQCGAPATATHFQHLTPSGGIGPELFELICPNNCQLAASVARELWTSDRVSSGPWPEPFVDPDADAVDPIAGDQNTEMAALKARLAEANDKIENLEFALGTSRHIGIALGIVMTTRHCTAQQAFDMLRDASQSRHVKLRDLAETLALTGDVSDLLGDR